MIERSKFPYVVTGEFIIAGENTVSGELHLRNREIELHLRRNTPFSLTYDVLQCVTGTLHNLRKISLLQNVLTSTSSYSGEALDDCHHATLSATHVIIGDRHIQPDVAQIKAIHLCVEDAPSLFYDFDAFSTVAKPERFIADISKTDIHDRPIPIGECPIIQYFAGKIEILNVPCEFGEISVRHSPSHSIGGPRGVHIDNKIIVAIRFRKAKTFEESMLFQQILMLFLKVAIGREQNVVSFQLELERSDRTPFLSVYSVYERQELTEGRRSPSPRDVLLWPLENPEEFGAVIRSWFEQFDQWESARFAAYERLGERRYDPSRLINVANAFDLLPGCAIPVDTPLSPDLRKVIDETACRFKELPPSRERDSVLSMLGRVSQPFLKKKIAHRAAMLTRCSGGRFPELEFVTDRAVELRNHIVHGAPIAYDLKKAPGCLAFLTDALEYVFLTSDLIECGWDFMRWLKGGVTLTHPMNDFGIYYHSKIAELKAVCRRN